MKSGSEIEYPSEDSLSVTIEETINDVDVDAFIQSIRCAVQPPLNIQDGISEITPLQKCVNDLADHIESIHLAIVKEAINIKNDLYYTLNLLITPGDLENIKSFYARILKNSNACSSRRNNATITATAGFFTLCGTAAVAFFMPAVVPVYAFYITSAIGTTLLPTGVGINLDTKNKRGTLVSLELIVFGEVLKQIKDSRNYTLYAKAHLEIFRMSAQNRGKNDFRDDIIQTGINSIIEAEALNQNVSLSSINLILGDVYNNLIGNSKNSKSAIDVQTLLTLLKEEDLTNNPNNTIEVNNSFCNK